jgi:hypothetical protein
MFKPLYWSIVIIIADGTLVKRWFSKTFKDRWVRRTGLPLQRKMATLGRIRPADAIFNASAYFEAT